MEKISWTDHVRRVEVLQRVKEERNILQTTKRRKAKWTGHILCKERLLKHVIEGKKKGRIDGGEEAEDVSSYWMTLRKRECTVN